MIPTSSFGSLALQMGSQPIELYKCEERQLAVLLSNSITFAIFKAAVRHVSASSTHSTPAVMMSVAFVADSETCNDSFDGSDISPTAAATVASEVWVCLTRLLVARITL